MTHPIADPYDSMGARMSERKDVSVQAAREALDSLDDYARMGVGVDAHGPRGMLERFIAQTAELIEAGREYDLARHRLEMLGLADARIGERRDALAKAEGRLRAALAACTPAKEGGR